MKHSIIKQYSDWLTESFTAEAEMAAAATTTADPGDLSQEVKFNFNFESGKYKQAEIPAAQLTTLKTDLTKPINLVKTPRYANQKTTLTLSASTSTLGLSAELRQQLTNEGYKPTGNGNDALCAARLNTLEAIVLSYFCEKLGCTADELKQRITIKKVSKANSGSGTTDEERKVYQYVSMKLEQTGEEIPADRKITCNMPASSKQGTQAAQTNNYVGYNADQYLVIPVGRQISIQFNPQSIPDMVYFKYKDTEFLSSFLGSKTGQNPQTKELRNYENEINDAVKYPGLKDAINKEIAKVGGTLTVETALATNGGYVNGKFVVLPGPGQQGEAGKYTFTTTKNFTLDNLTIRVFSPLQQTAFTIASACNTATTQTTTKKP